MSSSNLYDIEPGGESNQYESIRLFTEEPAKQTGQLGANSPHTKSEMKVYFDSDKPVEKFSQEDNREAQKLELGEETTNISGETDKDLKEDEAPAKARREQGYGPGSGVGA